MADSRFPISRRTVKQALVVAAVLLVVVCVALMWIAATRPA